MGQVLSAYEEYYQRLFDSEKTKIYAEITKKLKNFPIVVFMRGDVMEPKCKSSRLLVTTLTKMEVKFKSFNIL